MLGVVDESIPPRAWLAAQAARRQVAERLGVSASTVQRLVAGKSRVSPDVALQDSYDLWQARQSLDLSGLTPIELTAG